MNVPTELHGLTSKSLPPQNSDKVFQHATEVTFKDAPFVKSTLKTNLSWWKMHAPAYIVGIIEHGYIMPLSEYPPKSSAKNNKSALDHPDFVDDTIKKLLASGVLKLCEEQPHVVNPLTVASNSPTKLRLVLDLRLVNPFVSLAKMKFEDISVASKYFRKNQFLTSNSLNVSCHQSE